MIRILLLEDDESLIDGLKYTLEKNGFSPDIARTTAQARSLLEGDVSYDLLLLDVTLPDGTGFDICTHVRKKDSRTPIIFLTASDEEINIIRGLDSGGDDYITKPYSVPVLLARIKAVLRRTGGGLAQTDVLEAGGLCLSLTKGLVSANGNTAELTRNELQILACLMAHAGQIVSRADLIDTLWDHQIYIDDNTLSVNITRLRGKLAPTQMQRK